MKENKSEWAGGVGWGVGLTPHPAGPRAPAEPHFAARALPWAMPLLAPVDQAASRLGSHRGRGTEWRRIHAHQALRPFLPTSPGHAADL